MCENNLRHIKICNERICVHKNEEDTMAFLDEIDERLTRFGQDAIQKTKEASDNVKKSNTIRNLENKKKSLLLKLGENFYANYRVMAREEEANIICQIDDINHKIRDSHGILDKNTRGITYCQKCNAEIPVHSRFCNVCGAKIESSSNKGNTMNLFACSKCGAPLEKDQVFCTNCGTKVSIFINEEKIENNNMDYCEHDDHEKIYYKEEETGIPAQITCMECGAEIEPGQIFCTQCGTKL